MKDIHQVMGGADASGGVLGGAELVSGLRRDLLRLARFGANLTEAHSCCIFLPTRFLTQREGAQGEELLELGGVHSLSSDVFRECFVPRGVGLVGWVGRHNRAIHVSPFERDSRTLGIYTTDQDLKSFIGVPVQLPNADIHGDPLVGVVGCDSKKAFAFSKLQGKLLEELALEVGRVVELVSLSEQRGSFELSWQAFMRRGQQLVTALGQGAVEALRLKLQNYGSLEAALGSERALQLVEQTLRLVHQALPPHFPVLRLPNGDIVILLDNMMVSFYESRIRAICEHLGGAARAKGLHPLVEFEFVPSQTRRRRSAGVPLEQLVLETGVDAGAIDRSARGQSDNVRMIVGR